MSSLFLSNRIFTGEKGCGVFSGGVAVTNTGIIECILKSKEELDLYIRKNNVAPEMIHDYGDMILMPGLIDSHVHINEPGRETWEGFITATKSAAAGGFTTIVDMPLNSIPPTTTVSNFKTKLKSAKGKLHVDVAFWGGIVPGNLEDIKPLVSNGVVGFKCFLCPSGVDEFPHVNEMQIRDALHELEGTGTVLAFHAEIEPKQKIVLEGDTKRFETFLNSRPGSMEAGAIEMISKLSQEHKNIRMHIVHLSNASSIETIKECRANGGELTVETCFHYLTLAAEEVPDRRTDFKCTPPIRNKKNQRRLWQAVVEGDIDLVVSDHSPSTAELKLLHNGKNCGDFLKAWGGIASNQFGLSLFWTNCSQYSLGIEDIHRLMCENPAKLCGLDNCKSLIRQGYSADFCIWAPDEEFTIRPSMVYFKNKDNPYMGKTFRGVVYATILRGDVIYDRTKGFTQPLGNVLLSNVL